MKRNPMKIAAAVLMTLCLFNSTLITALAQTQHGKTQPPKAKPAETKQGVEVAGPNASNAAPKFALLVGINNYSPKTIASGVNPLKGCENDVDAMKKLLTKYYGFADDAEHIVTLKSSQATKKAILDAFENHLVKNAEKFKGQNPTIVFYISSHGSRTTDLDGDEGDGQDETLVPYDRKESGDIIDDEIDEKFQKLQKTSTTNITFILDSCHSGTASRDVSDLIAREAPSLDANLSKDGSSPIVESKKDKGNAILSRDDSYVTISGSLPYERSYEREKLLDEDGVQRAHGLMTYYLVQTLSRSQNPDARLSYAELGEILRKKVNLDYQTPQVEGNLRREVFEGADPNALRYITVLDDEEDNKITIDAGKVQGIQDGALLEIYPKKKKDGKLERLATAAVDKAEDFSSKVVMKEDAVKIAKGDRVLILTPGLSSSRLPVFLGTETKNKTAADALAKVRNLLTNYPFADAKDTDKSNPLVEVVAAQPREGKAEIKWNTQVVAGTFADFRKDLGTQPEFKEEQLPCMKKPPTKPPENNLPAKDTDEVFYLKTRDGTPFGGFYVKADDPKAAEKIVDALEKRAQQLNVASISNTGSELNKGLTINLLKVEIDRSSCKEKFEPTARIPIIENGVMKSGAITLNAGERFRFEIDNNTGREIHLTLLALDYDGSIKPATTPTEFGGGISANRTGVRSARQRATPPAGKTIYKFLVTTKPTDFSFLYREGVSRGENDKAISSLTDPFARLVGGAFSGMRTGRDEIANPDDWTTIDLDLIVTLPKS